jgi:hypothetical protein
MTPVDSMIKECDEEASFPEDFVKKHIKCVNAAGAELVTDE